MAHERRKLQLKAAILGGRARIAGEQDRVKRAREELHGLTPKKTQNVEGAIAGALRTVKLG
jgi:hypothetical protein